MKKRLLSALLALCMILSLFPASAFASTGDTWGGVNASTLSASLDDLDAENANDTTREVNNVSMLVGAIEDLNKGTFTIDVIKLKSGTVFDLSDSKWVKSSSDLEIKKGVTIDGNGATLKFGKYYMTILSTTASVKIENVTITGGTGDDIIQVGNSTNQGAKLELDKVTFDHCGKNRVLSACDNGEITMTDSTINGSSAASLNNAVHLYRNSTLTMKGNSKITGCTTTGNKGGGAVNVDSGCSLIMEGTSEISGCSTSDSIGGGAVYVSGNGGKLEMKDTSKITGNKATNGIGGGVYINDGGTLTVSDTSALYGNTATGAADVYAGKGSIITLPAASSMGGENITGWHKDASDDRHKEDDPNEAVDPAHLSTDKDGKLTEPLSLIASRSSAHTVTVKVTLDGNETSNNNIAGAYSDEAHKTSIAQSTATKPVYLYAPNATIINDGSTYKFVGWSADPTTSITNSKATSASFTMPDNDITLIAQYKKAIQVKVDGTPAKDSNGNTWFVPGEQVTIDSKLKPDTSNEDKVFAEWGGSNKNDVTTNTTTDDDDHVTGTVTIPTGATSDITITTVPKYKVTVTGGTIGDTNKSTGYAKENEQVKLTPASSSDQQFNSWTVTKKNNETVTVDNNGTFKMPASPVIATANTSQLYTVTVDGNELTNPKTNTKYFAEDDSVSFTSKYPAESSGEDTVFDSWNRDSESTGLTINGSTGANNTIQGSFTMPDHNVVLTSVPKYKVNVIGGTVTKLYSTPSYSASSMYVTEGTTISIASSYGVASANPDKDSAGTVFYKWTSSNYSTLNESTSQPVTFQMPAQPITVTSVNKYKVTVVDGTYGTNSVNIGYEEAGHTIDMNTPTSVSGKTFKGWVVTPENSGANVNGNSVTTPKSGMAITITASYDDNLYTVYVNGMAVKPNVTKDTTVTFTSADVENLTKETAASTEDVVFGEWSVDTTPEGSQSVTIADKANPELSFSMPAGNVYLTYSKKYKVTVTDGTINGTDKNIGYFEDGANISLTYTGETGTFKKWEKTADGETTDITGDSFTMTDKPTTVKAVKKGDPDFNYTGPTTVTAREDLTSDEVKEAIKANLTADKGLNWDNVEWVYCDKDGNELTNSGTAPTEKGDYTFKLKVTGPDYINGIYPADDTKWTFSIVKEVEPVIPEEPADGDGGIGGAIAAGALIGGATYLVGTHVWLNNIYGFIPTNRIELAKALWNKADCSAPVSTELYPDIDEDDTDAQSAARWVVEQGLMKDYTRTNDDGTQTVTFKPGRYVFRPYALSRWYELEKLLNEQQAAQAEAPAETTAD